ncbi:MAG: helix-turn-helix transcriptional regulator [Proteobacteria bacterium]|nr:helix-turn-helix transcriptional regulator [Pseudomonadota bacterium]
MPSSNAKQILAENVRRLRLSAGLSQEELAARADLHRTYISSIERSKRNVTLKNIFLLAQALGVTPATLVTPAEDSESG